MPKAKTYPLDVMNVGGDVYCLMSKGHHDPHEFMREARAQGYDWPLRLPTHQWVKTVPCGPGCGEHRCHYELSDVPRKGWFPATYTWEAYGDDVYKPPATDGVPVAPKTPDGEPS